MDSNIIYKSKLHWISYFQSFILMIIGVVGIPLFIVGAFIGELNSFLGGISIILSLIFLKGLYDFFYLRKISIYLFNKYLSFNGGVFGKWQMDIKVEDLEGQFIYQSFLGLKLGFGTLEISTKGGKALKFFIKNPQELNRKIKILHQ